MGTENNSAIANKLLNQDGSITNFSGDILQAANDYGIEDWQRRAPIANKFENPDGTIHTLDEIIGGGGGIPEAPNDGKQYGRQSESWTEVIGDTYSTTEVDTGKKWIDGKAIYKIVFSGYITCKGNVNSTEILVSSGADKLINYSVFLQNGGSSNFFSLDGSFSAETTTISGKIFCSTNNQIRMYTFSAFMRDGTPNSGSGYYGFVEYTKI